MADGESVTLSELHPARRTGLPPEVKAELLPMPRPTWRSHPNYGGKAGFFLQFHGGLLQLADSIVEILGPETDPTRRSREAVQRASLLLQRTHGHHQMEDRLYFPALVRQFPGAAGAMALLERDHGHLDPALLELYHGCMDLREDRELDPRPAQEQARALHRLLVRHLTDEEEVIIPLFLQAGF